MIDQASTRNRKPWIYFVAKHATLIGVSIVASLIAMYRVQNGWECEPLIWLSAVWYFPLLLVTDFIFLRGQGRLGTLMAITTAIALIIMFPFSQIRMAQARARVVATATKTDAKIQYCKPQSIWNWWRITPEKIIPVCLAWRVPSHRIQFDHLIISNPNIDVSAANETVSNEFWNISIQVSSTAIPGRPTSKIRSNPMRLKPQFLTISKRQSDRTRCNGDWIVDAIDFQNVQHLTISDVDFSAESWARVLSGKKFLNISLNNTNGSATMFNRPHRFRGLNSITLKHIDLIDERDLVKAIEDSQSLKNICLSAELATGSLFRHIVKTPVIKYVTVDGIRVASKFDGACLATAKKVFTFRDCISLDLSAPLFESIKNSSGDAVFSRCHFTCQNLINMSSTRFSLQYCFLSKAEYNKFLQLMADSDSELSCEERARIQKVVNGYIRSRQLQIVLRGVD